MATDLPPVSEERHRRLKDGTPVSVLRLSGGDAEQGRVWLRQRIEEGYESLSPRSRRLRFVSPPHHLAPWQLDYLSDLDPGRTTIWLARDDTPGRPVGIGLARCMRLSEASDSAEVAFTVLDDYQNRGMGWIFVQMVVDHARKRGLRQLIGYVLPENRAMLHLLYKAGARPPVDEGGMLRVEWVCGDKPAPVGGE